MRQIIGMLGLKGSGKDTCADVLVNQCGFKRTSFARTLYQESAAAQGQPVSVLENRLTKEQDLRVLALRYNTDGQFVEVALSLLKMNPQVRRAVLRFWQTGKHTRNISHRLVAKVLKQGRSPRWLMQLWGTEYRRKSKFGVDSYWLDRVRLELDAEPDQNFVITDVRFNVEADFVEIELQGQLYRVRRPELERLASLDRTLSGTATHASETEVLTRKVAREFLNTEGDRSRLLREVRDSVRPALTLAA